MNEFDLSPAEMWKIINFLGYGRLSAPVWFIGLEEGLGGMNDEDKRKNLKARGSFQGVMDLREAHLRLRKKGKPIDIEANPPSTQAWRWMAKIMRARDGHADWQDPTLAKEYVRLHLGRCDGNTFMTELSPIPKSKTTDKCEHLKKPDPEIVENRRDELILALKKNPKLLVICYGSGGRRSEDFAEFLGVEWQPILDSPGVYGAKDSRRLLLLPFFGLGRMSSGVVANLLGSGLLG